MAQSGTDYEAVAGEEMAPNVAKKPTVEYDGYERTITGVVRIQRNRQSQRVERGEDAADVATLMDGLDKAIKDCRSLRQRLERIHRKRNTGYYQQVNRREPEPEPT
jgi:hypothetical protein